MYQSEIQEIKYFTESVGSQNDQMWDKRQTWKIVLMQVITCLEIPYKQ